MQGLLRFGVTRMRPRAGAWFTRHIRLPASEKQGCSALYCESLDSIHIFMQLFSKVCNLYEQELLIGEVTKIAKANANANANANAPLASN